MIAISVIYKGFDNLDGFRRWIGIEPPNLLGMVFGFGLIHGFGLSTRLQQIGLPDDGLFSRIFAFNVGVELGQIAALIAMLAVLALFRKSRFFAPFSALANAFLVIAGSLLFLFQIHGYLHTTYPDDFGFSSNQHIIDHFNNDVRPGDQTDYPERPPYVLEPPAGAVPQKVPGTEPAPTFAPPVPLSGDEQTPLPESPNPKP